MDLFILPAIDAISWALDLILKFGLIFFDLVEDEILVILLLV